jgi:hypothetical protein
MNCLSQQQSDNQIMPFHNSLRHWPGYNRGIVTFYRNEQARFLDRSFGSSGWNTRLWQGEPYGQVDWSSDWMHKIDVMMEWMGLFDWRKNISLPTHKISYWILNISQTCRSPRPVTGIASVLYMQKKSQIHVKCEHMEHRALGRRINISLICILILVCGRETIRHVVSVLEVRR